MELYKSNKQIELITTDEKNMKRYLGIYTKYLSRPDKLSRDQVARIIGEHYCAHEYGYLKDNKGPRLPYGNVYGIQCK